MAYDLFKVPVEFLKFRNPYCGNKVHKVTRCNDHPILIYQISYECTRGIYTLHCDEDGHCRVDGKLDDYDVLVDEASYEMYKLLGG